MSESLLHLLQSSGAGLNTGWLRGKFPFVVTGSPPVTTVDEPATIAQLEAVASELIETLGGEEQSRRVVAAGAVILHCGQMLSDLRANLLEKSAESPLRQSTETAFVSVQAEVESGEALVLELLHDKVNNAPIASWESATASLYKTAQFLLAAFAGLITTLTVEEPASPNPERISIFAANVQRMTNVLHRFVPSGEAATKDIMRAIGVAG